MSEQVRIAEILDVQPVNDFIDFQLRLRRRKQYEYY